MLLRLAPWLFVSMWSTGYIAMKFAAPFAEPFTFLSIRFALVVAVLAPFIVAGGFWRIGWRDAAAAAVVGSLLHGVYLAGIFWAIKQGMPAGVAAIIISLQPLVSACLVAPLLAERVEFRHWIGLVLGLIGAVIVLLPSAKLDGAIIRPDMLAMSILALASITLGTTLQKTWCSHLDVRSSLLPQYVGALLVMAAAAFLLETREVNWSVQAVGAMAWLVLVLSVGAISLLLMLLKRNEVWRTVTLFYLVPPFTAVSAWVLFDEQLQAVQLVGMGLVIIAMLLARPRASS
ncbi:MAG: drug/metabolite transporter (DMT)-like permease [Hyphomicrobiaceae bacterium]|jgi:drug/metabolite transporter (DMT)-like permease